jgi:hypothetical protein
MEYKVVPFHPTITDKVGTDAAAKELQLLIENITNQGWKFVSLESLTTTVKPTGCASLGSKNEILNVQLVIFSK